MIKYIFLDAVRMAVLRDIREAYWECEHGPGRPIDYKRLHRLLQNIFLNAKNTGVSRSEFDELVMIMMPGLLNQAHFAQQSRDSVREAA